jgi:biopolymer transport protein ExbD
MRFRSRRTLPKAEAEMTPMIDMAFQLIAFFMVLINFSETAADQQVKLPISELARPADQPPQRSFTLNMNQNGQLRHLGQVLEIEEIVPYLQAEQREVRTRRLALGTDEQTSVIIRSDANCPSGKVQQLMQLCQQYGFEKFVLRAQEREG